MTRPFRKNLDLLATSLANNYVCSALGPNADHSRLLNPNARIQNYNRRVIVIVGSGASQDAALPGTKDLIAKLRTPAFPLPPEVVEKELDRLESVQKLDRHQFETCLLAMSATEHSGKVVRDTLVKIYSRRFLPTLGYETLAHLLKHKFVDAIISFNFDELLDQAISDELNPSEYHFILSDGDCPSLPLPRNHDVLEKPFYIKPHGTVSHSSTLRFTRDDYYRLPLGIQRVIRELLTNRPVDLISIGFDMKSFEFNYLVRESLTESRIFYINLHSPEPDPPFGNQITSHLIPVVPKTRPLGKVLEETLEKTYEKFLEFYPRDIHRHRLIANLFAKERDEETDNADYLWDRTVIELALAIAKTKGFITMSGLSAGRTGKYFKEYQKKSGRKKLLKSLCADIGLRDVAYGSDVLRLLTTNGLSPKILTWPEFTNSLSSFMSRVRDQLTTRRQRVFDTFKDQFEKTLKQHYKGAEVEVRAAAEVLHDNLFQTPKVFRSKTALDCKTAELLESRQWKSLLLVSETGEWLTQPRIKRAIDAQASNRRRIYLIVADESHKNTLVRDYQDRIMIKSMPWWDHNRHLTLFLDRNHEVIHSIYFTRQRRTSDIVPVFLEKSDSQMVFEFWKAYWIRATEPGVWIDRDRIDGFVFPPVNDVPKIVK